MKLTLAFQVYNKEESIKSVMDSWVCNLSGRNECEIIVVFDDCKDASVDILHKYLRDKKQDYMFLFADDRYEIFCNNLALKHASGDYIIFIQDDNWIYDENWDLLLAEAIGRVDNLGAVAFLAGVQLLPNGDRIDHRRIEIDRPHKGQYFTIHNLPSYELGVWRVDSIARPFCISRELLLSCGGLDAAFSPTCGDDLDLGIKLLKQGRTNLYIPFDLLNTVASKETFEKEYYTENYKRAYAINFERHHEYIAGRPGGNVELLFPMRQTPAGQLVFEKPKDRDQADAPVSHADVLVGDVGGETPFTLFAMPKAFTGAFATIQRNAIGSWMQLRSRPEIILLGNDDGVADFARINGLRRIPGVKCNEFGTPLLNALFSTAQAAASNEICVYVNADIILMDDFAEAIEIVARRFNQFLMVGRRWDIDISQEIDFGEEDWRQRLIDRVRREGVRHAPTGIDYFAFKKALWPEIPPMALGRDVWDNWLVREPLLMGRPVIDASGKVMIVHQNHDFSHIPGGKKSASFNIEQQRNIELGGNDRSLAYTSHATWELTPAGIAIRPIIEFLKEDNLSAALKCIESAYQQAPEAVREQCEALRLQVNGELRGRLLAAAAIELASGLAKNAARLLLDCLEAGARSAAEGFFKRGFQCLNDGDASQAVKHLEQAARNCATLPNFYYALATAYARVGDIASAQKACRIELSLQPGNRGAAELLERIGQALNEYDHSLVG